MWTSTKDLVRENLAEISQIKEKLAELDQVKTQLDQIKGDVEQLRNVIENNNALANDSHLAIKKDLVRCLDLLSSDDLSKQVEGLKNNQSEMGMAMQEILRNVSLLDDANRLILANLLLKDMNV